MRAPISAAILLSAAIAIPAAAQQQPSLLGQALGMILGKKATQSTTSPAATGSGVAATRRAAPVLTFDVAGIRIGDTPAQVRAAFAASGYRVTDTLLQRTWQRRLEEAVGTRRGIPSRTVGGATMPKSLTAEKPGGGRLYVQFRQVPTGVIVMSVEWGIYGDLMADAPFTAQVLAKYGAPTIHKPEYGSRFWCEDPTSCDSIPDARTPTFQASTLGGPRLDLTVGHDAVAITEAAFAAEVDRLAPRLDKAAF